MKRARHRATGASGRARARRRSPWWTWAPVVFFAGVVAVFFAVTADPGGSVAAVSDRDPEQVAAGEALYSTKCAACHGPDLRGSATGPPFLDPTYAPNHHPDEAFLRAVSQGVPPHHWNFGAMPPVPDTSEEDVAAIVAFVRTRQEELGILRDPRHP